MKNNKPHFLLIHGAWHGGWVWNEISEILRYQRYSVSTPTLTGLGEKKHLLSSKITIETFIEDVVNHIIFENLNNIILVGHSFAGSVISGVAERLKDRNRRPLLKNMNLHKTLCGIYHDRRKSYEDTADLIIETDGKSLDRIASIIQEKFINEENHC